MCFLVCKAEHWPQINRDQTQDSRLTNLKADDSDLTPVIGRDGHLDQSHAQYPCHPLTPHLRGHDMIIGLGCSANRKDTSAR